MSLAGRFTAEYAKSSRSKCQHCSKPIAQGCLRVGKLVNSDKFDGVIPLWHHLDCILDCDTIPDVSSIDGFEKLRPADQQNLKTRVVPHQTASAVAIEQDESIPRAASSGESTRKRARETKSGAADEEDEHQTKWRKMDAEALRTECQARGVETAGTKDDLLARLAAVDAMPLEELEQPQHEAALQTEAQQLWEIKDALNSADGATTAVLKEMLESNGVSSKGGRDTLLDRCADGLLYGALPVCPDCKKPRLEFRHGRYHCTAASEWSKCLFEVDTIVRTPWKMPQALRSSWRMPASCQNAVQPLEAHRWKAERARALKAAAESESDRATEARKAQRAKNKQMGRMFRGIAFVWIGKLHTFSNDAARDAIVDCGGTVTNAVGEAQVVLMAKGTFEQHKQASAVIQEKMQEAMDDSKPILDETFLQDAVASGIAPDVSKYLLSDQDDADMDDLADILRTNRLAVAQEEAERKVRVKVKHGAAVHPESGMIEYAHVYKDGHRIYDAVLNLTDVGSGMNSYYMLQVIKHDTQNVWYLSRKWGRVGTKSGGHKIEEFRSQARACDSFESLFLDKTGNAWQDQVDGKFVKKPGKFYPIQVDYGHASDEDKSAGSSGSSMVPRPSGQSRLDPRLQDLIRILFDIQQMKQVMLEMEIDTDKMPLGKLSRAQLYRGFEVLQELQTLIEATSPANESALANGSNRFYTLVPHSFGHKRPTVLRTLDQLRQKVAMVETLLELEAATVLMSSSGDEVDNDPLEANYRKLKADLTPLPRDGDEWRMIARYVKNTHGATHCEYDLELLDAFSLDRHGEADRYRKFSDFPNRQLLWHGSRTTNFIGILSQGLRIAPKAIYTADCVSKSANYCFTSEDNPVGFLLLCEVALGSMYTRTHSEYMDQPPTGFHSTKGCGRTVPDSSQAITLPDGCVIPLGKSTVSGIRDTSLEYNEYMIYSPDQLKMRYLIKLGFQYK